MKNITTSLYAIARYDYKGFTTKGKEYAVFKIHNTKHGQRITIVDDSGRLNHWGVNEFQFITK